MYTHMYSIEDVFYRDIYIAVQVAWGMLKLLHWSTELA